MTPPNSNLQSGEHFLSIAAPLARRIGWPGVEKISAVVLQLTGDHLPAYLSLMEFSAELLDRLVALAGKATALEMYEWTGRIARYHPRPASYFLEKSPDLLKLIGYRGVDHVAETIENCTRFDWQTAARLSYQSDLYCRNLLQPADAGLAAEAWSLAARVSRERAASVPALLDTCAAVITELMARHDRQRTVDLLTLVHSLAGKAPLLAEPFLQRIAALTERLTPDQVIRFGDLVTSIAAVNSESAVKLTAGAPDLFDRLPADHRPDAFFEVVELAVDQMSDSARLAEAMCQAAPDFIRRAGFDTLRQTVDLCRTLGRDSRPAADNLFAVAGDLIERIGFDGLRKTADAGRSIAALSPQGAASFIAKSTGLIERISAPGLWRFADFCRHMAASGPAMAARFPEQSLGVMDRLLERGDAGLIETTYDLADRLGRINPMMAIKFLDQAPVLIDRIGIQGLEKFSDIVLHLARSSWTAADALIRSSPEILDSIGYDGLEEIAALSLTVAANNVYTALSLLEKSPALLGRLMAAGYRRQVSRVLAQIKKTASVDGTLALALWEKCPELIERAGPAFFEKMADVCLRMAAGGTSMAMALLDAGMAIGAEVETPTWLGIAEFWLEMSRHPDTNAADRLKRSSQQIGELMQVGGSEAPARVYRLVRQVAAHNRSAAMNLLDRSAGYIDSVGFEGLRQLASKTLALSQIDRQKAARFAAGDSIEFADFMENIPKGLRLEQIRTVLYNYLAALLGYRLEIVAGTPPTIDRNKIVLPEKVREFREDDKNFIYYKVLATHLEAHLEYESFDLDIERARGVFATVSRRYGSQYRSSRGDVEGFYRMFPEPRLAEDLVNLLEDYRIDQRLQQEYPALAGHIRMVNAHELKKRPSPEKIANPKQRTVETISQALLSGDWNRPAGGQLNEIMTLAHENAQKLSCETADFHDVLAASADLCDWIDRRWSEPYRPRQAPAKAVDPKQIHRNIGGFGKTSRQILDRLHRQSGQQPAGAGGSETRGEPSRSRSTPARRAPRQERVPQALQKAAGAPRRLPNTAEADENRESRISSGQRDTGGSSSGMKFGSTQRIAKLLRELYKQRGITPKEIEHRTRRMRPDQIGLLLRNIDSIVRVDGELETEKGSTLYSEWDDGSGGYRQNWSRIREQAMPSGSRSFYRETLVKHAGLLKKVRREFQMMRPEDLTRLNRQPDGEEIDLDATIEYLVDRRIGISPSENNYRRTDKRERDIAVAVLIDMSKSTRGRTLRCQKEALVILSEALDQVGDAFAVFGFSGDNRDNVDFYRIKDFEEPYRPTVHRRISAIDCGLENRDGAALRHTTSLMKRRSEKTKLVILISDGKPVDKEYSGRYAIEDTRKALLEAQKAGIKSFCITVDQTAPDYLPRMYRHSNWVVIDDVTRLPEKITRIFARLTT